MKPREQWGPDLTPHERVMLDNIFLAGDETRLSSLKNRFYTVIPVVRQDIMASLKSKGIYLLDPESANGYSIAAGHRHRYSSPFAVQVLGWINLFNSIPLLIGSVLLSALIWWLFARQMTAKTFAGARIRIAVLGFRGVHEPRRCRSFKAHAPRHL